MNNKFVLPYKIPKPSNILPPTIISLEDWSVVTVTGKDSLNFLQGQFTTDIFLIGFNQYAICAHCNANGKTLSNMYLFRYSNGMAYILRNSVKKKQAKELQKYSIFSKVSINYKKNFVLFGIAGYQIRKILSNVTMLPNKQKSLLQTEKDFYLLWFNHPSERFLIVTTLEKAKIFKKKIRIISEQNNSSQWKALDIESGYPIIDEKNIKKFTPQAFNLKELKAISFIKGCYSGQEVITKINFRGGNKDAMYWLSGKFKKLPKIGESLEIKIDKKWILTGKILTYVKLNHNKIWIQAIIKKQILKESQAIRISKDVNSELIQLNTSL